MSNFTLYTDGGARGNPGPGAAGIVLKSSSRGILKEIGKYLGTCTNNEAEYRALIIGLKAAKNVSAKTLTCYLDSELVVKQLKGEYRVKSLTLKPLFKKAKKLEGEFDKVYYRHVTRSKNFRADKLVNEVLDSV